MLRKRLSETRVIGKQFIRFALVGCLNSFIHYVIFLVLYKVTFIHYLLASGIGYTAGFLNSFVLNRLWTFKSKGDNKYVEFTKFIIINCISLLVNFVVLASLINSGIAVAEIAQIVAIGFSLSFNFLGNKYWTFA